MLCSGADTELLEFGAVKRCRKENPTRFFLGAESESETQLNHMHRDTERERDLRVTRKRSFEEKMMLFYTYNYIWISLYICKGPESSAALVPLPSFFVFAIFNF